MRVEQLKLDGDLNLSEVPSRVESELSKLLNLQHRWRTLADSLRGYYELR